MKFNQVHPSVAIAVLVFYASTAWAGEGHDHGEAPSSVGVTALPRFTAASDTFELVGVLSGKQITLYLDRFSDNAPVPNAQIALDLGGMKFIAEKNGDAVYEVVLKELPKAGVLPITVTVTAGAESDLLVGELDIHDAAPADAVATARPWGRWAGWAVGGAAALALLVFGARRVLRSRSSNALRVGSAT
jgi:hypothetical protein